MTKDVDLGRYNYDEATVGRRLADLLKHKGVISEHEWLVLYLGELQAREAEKECAES